MSNEFEVDTDALIGHLSDLAQSKKAISEKSGELSKQLERINETEGYEAQAMAMIRKIDAMSETKRADCLRTFVPMFEGMLLAKWSDDDMLDGLDERDPDKHQPGDDDLIPEVYEAPMEAEATTEEGLEDFNAGGNVETLHGDVA